MFYHAINGEGTGPVPPVEDLSPVLLWTNPNPITAFAAQTIALDLSEYDSFIVEYIVSTETDTPLSFYGKKNSSYNNWTGIGGLNGGSTNARGRGITNINDTGITFSDSYEGSSVNNKQYIPNKIYGVKEYVVEPKGPIEIVGAYHIGTVSPTGGTTHTTKTYNKNHNFEKDVYILVCIEGQDNGGTINSVSWLGNDVSSIYTQKVSNATFALYKITKGDGALTISTSLQTANTYTGYAHFVILE